MGFELVKENYSGGIKEITLGKGDSAITVGGETCYPFYAFEGDMPNKPKIAMEVWDMEPDDWPESVLIPFKDVISDPAAWAKKCVDEYGADMIALQLKSTDPNTKDAPVDAAVATVKKVLDAVDVPLIVWGTANVQKDEEVLKGISEACQGANLILGPVEDKNHKGIGASAMGFGHTLISSSPIDVNLAKQINILLENLGMPSRFGEKSRVYPGFPHRFFPLFIDGGLKDDLFRYRMVQPGILPQLKFQLPGPPPCAAQCQNELLRPLANRQGPNDIQCIAQSDIRGDQ